MNRNWFFDKIHYTHYSMCHLLYWNTENAFFISTGKNASSLLSNTTNIQSKNLLISYENFKNYNIEDNKDNNDYLDILDNKSKKNIVVLIRNPYKRFLSAFNSDVFQIPETTLLNDKLVKNEILQLVKSSEIKNMILKNELQSINDIAFIESHESDYNIIYNVLLTKYFKDVMIRQNHNNHYMVFINQLISFFEKNNIKHFLIDLDKEKTDNLIMRYLGVKKLDNFRNSQLDKNYFLDKLLNNSNPIIFSNKIKEHIFHHLHDEYWVYNNLSKKCINYK